MDSVSKLLGTTYCPTCGGEGTLYNPWTCERETCPECGGIGVVADERPADLPYTQADYVQLAALARDVLGQAV